MTQPGPGFTGWAATSPLHRSGFFALALQDAPGVFKEPTTILRETGGGEMMPTEEGIVPKFFAGTNFRPYSQPGASEYNTRTVNVELDAVTIALVIRAMYGEPVDSTGTGIITPLSNRQWSQYFPARSFSGYWYVPSIGHVKITDGQFYSLQGTVPDGNELITATLGFHAAKAEPMLADAPGYVPPTIAVPDFEGAFSRSDATLLYDGVELPHEGGLTFNLNRPIEPGGKNGRYTSSFKPGNGYVDATVSTTLTGGRPDIVGAARQRPRVLKPLELRLAQGDPASGGVRISLKAPTAEITSANAPISDGAVTTSVEFATVIPNPAAKPFTVELAGDYA